MRKDRGGDGNEKIDWGMFARLATGLGDEWDLGSEHKRGTSDDCVDFGSGNHQLGWINSRGNRIEQKSKEFFPYACCSKCLCDIQEGVSSRQPDIQTQGTSQVTAAI